MYNTLNLYSAASAGTATEGGIYYDSGAKVIKLYDGSAWYTVGTSTDGLNLAGTNDFRVQLSDLSNYMTFGTTTQSGLSMLTLEATSTAAIPLTLRGYNAQTANLLQVHNVGGTELFAIDAYGNASSTKALTVTGNLYTNGTFDVDGMATTTVDTGAIATEGGLTAKGNISFDGGTFIFNESSADLDFRVESNGNANMLFVDGGTDRVGIASSTPEADLSVGTLAATTTIQTGRLCFATELNDGSFLYLYPCANGDGCAAGQAWATSTTSCK